MGLVLLAGFSLFLRTRALGSPLWIDEGLSVGIGSHHLADIPAVLREDGSPPIYYMLLHIWMSVFGRSEAAIQSLSTVFAVLAVPAAFWAGDSLLGRRTAWMAAIVFALNPFLTQHGQEARMYALISLLSLLAVACFAQAFVLRRRRFLIGFAAALTTMVYTHSWSFFFAAGTVVALAWLVREADGPERRRLLRDAALAYGAAALLYLPWLPTFIFQTRHTGAPWASAPNLNNIIGVPTALLGGPGSATALLFGAGVGVAAALAARGRERRVALTLAVVAVSTLVIAAVVNEVSPAWASRYFAIFVGPLLLLVAAGLARGGRLALVALLLIVVSWGQPHGYSSPTLSERAVIRKIDYMFQPGSLVIDTHPERAAVVSYYMPKGMRYADLFGFDSDPGVMDWRDAYKRLRWAKPWNVVPRLLDTVKPGSRVILVRPVIRTQTAWQAPWTHLVERRASEWARRIRRDPRFVLVADAPRPLGHVSGGIRILVYERKKPQ